MTPAKGGTTVGQVGYSGKVSEDSSWRLTLFEEGITGNEPVILPFKEAIRNYDVLYESSDTFCGRGVRKCRRSPW
jgi:hypothetical protein